MVAVARGVTRGSVVTIAAGTGTDTGTKPVPRNVELVGLTVGVVAGVIGLTVPEELRESLGVG